MPERTTTRTLALTASALALLTLTGCGQFTVPVQGDPFPAPPTRSVDELLGIDRGDDGALFDAASDAILAELLNHAREVSEQADADLASAIRQQPAGDGPSAMGPGIAPVEFTAPAAGGTPGVDVPVVTNTSTTTTGTQDGRSYTTVTTDTNTVKGQREVTVHDATTTVGTPETGNGSTQRIVTTQEKNPCAAEGEPAGTYTIEQTQTINRDGVLLMVDITTTGTVVRAADGTVSLRDVTVSIDASGTGPDGASTTGNGFTVNADIDGWDTRGDITDARGRFTVAETNGVSEKDAIALAGAQLDAYRGLASDVVDRGDDLRDSRGLCVRIVVDTGGVTSLADGEEAEFEARVIDPGTGEEITDAPIVAESSDGDVTPRNATGHGRFTFTASGDPLYRASLSTDTPRGGHDVQVTYGAEGWQFEGVSYSFVTADRQVPVTVTWNGKVCGDVSDEWDFNWQMQSPVASPSANGTQRPVELSDVTPGDRVILVYQEIPNPRDGEPPFKLWIDDQNSGMIPNHQRVEVHPEPLTEPCVDD